MTDQQKGGRVLHDAAESLEASGSFENYVRGNQDVLNCMMAMLSGCDRMDPETVVNAALLIYCALLRVEGNEKGIALDLVEAAYDSPATTLWVQRLGRAITRKPDKEQAP